MPDFVRPLTADSKHVNSSLVQLDEDTIVNLSQTEKLENFLDLGRDLVDTTNSHDKCKFGISWHIVVAFFPCFASQPVNVTNNSLKVQIRGF